VVDADAIEPLTPLSPARSFAPSSQTIARCSFRSRPRAPDPVKGFGVETIRGAFHRYDVRAIERSVDPHVLLLPEEHPIT